MAGARYQVHDWNELPTTTLLGGTLRRTGFRGDNCLITFNRIAPTMPRWEPHQHPFDQIVLTLAGRQMLEIDGEAFEMGPGTITKVPANAMHTGWPVGDEMVMNIDVFPPRPDYLFLVAHQSEYPRAAGGHEAYHQHKGAPFTGRIKQDTSGLLHRWDDLPRHERWGGFMSSSCYRGDDSLLAFNRMPADRQRLEPHSHPFDQIVMVLKGRMKLEIDGQVLDMGPRAIVRVPGGLPHSGWPDGEEELLNLDVFSPPRQDYLFMCAYQKEYPAVVAG